LHPQQTAFFIAIEAELDFFMQTTRLLLKSYTTPQMEEHHSPNQLHQ
jgi:hypothetical protein